VADAFELGPASATCSPRTLRGRRFGRNLLDAEIVQNGIDFDNLTGMTNEPARSRRAGDEF